MLDLWTLPGGPPTRPFGINNDGAITGQGTSAGGTLHAFVWLPRPLYGFQCPGLPGIFDLHVLAPATPPGQSIGYEVNKAVLSGPTLILAAQVAGQVSAGTGEFSGDGFVWTIANGAVTTTLLPSVTIAARSISDATGGPPALVVGDARVTVIINCHGSYVSIDAHSGFRVALDGSNQLVFLEHAENDIASFARDVNAASPPRVAGYSDLEPAAVDCTGAVGCDLFRDAVYWETTMPITLAAIDAAFGGAQSLGINDLGDIVGSSCDQFGNGGIRNAALWRAPYQTPVVLGNQPPLDAASETVANAINNASLRQIVGVNALTQHALLWEEKPGGWEDVLDLDTAACDCNNDFTLVEALDINDSGWIVARGSATGGDHAYLLRRVSACAADLNGDGQVDKTDLNILLLPAHTGPCCSSPPCPPEQCNDLCCACLGDLNGDCTRTKADQSILIGSYGPCPGFGTPCVSDGGSAGAWMQHGVQALGFASVAAYQSWLATHSESHAHTMGLALVAVLPH